MKNHDSYDSDEFDLTFLNEVSIKPPVYKWAIAAAQDTDSLWAEFERDIQS